MTTRDIEKHIKSLVAADSHPVSSFKERVRVDTTIKNCPKRGVYVFYMDNIPIYIGRSNRLPERIKEYVKLNTRLNDNPLVLNRAKELARGEYDFFGMSIERLDKDKIGFGKYFEKSKDDLLKMSIKVLEIDSEVEQCLFESYYSLKFGTKYNGVNNSLLGIYGLLPITK